MHKLQSIEFRSSFNRTCTTSSLTIGSEYFIGSSEKAHISFQGDGIAGQHAKLICSQDGMRILPVNQSAVSLNGNSIVESTHLESGDWLSLGPCLFQVIFPELEPQVGTSVPSQPQVRVLTIGRLASCDVTIPSPLVSRAHAKLNCGPDGVVLEDLQSTNGTFVNGRQIHAPTLLKKNDHIAISSFLFQFTGEMFESIDLSGRVRVEVQGLRKEVLDRSNKQLRILLDDINFVVEPGEFVVIFGTSGSGKSTLLDALNGRRPASQGHVFYNGTDLYTSFNSFRATIGYVPQQDIVHRKITIQRALEYTARLRLPPDTSDQEIGAYIKNVLDKVGLAEKALQPINTPVPLSGGQLKRVSLAVELVSNPNILFLDEVTSGLDAGTDKRMMRLFADLAADQKTVICVTHTLENIDVCHHVVLLHKGRMIYFGPPQEAAGYFEVERLSDVYELIDSNPNEFWAEKFRNSVQYQKYILDRVSSQSNRDNQQQNNRKLNLINKVKSWFDWRQAIILIRRYLDLIVSDKKNLLILFLQAPLIAVIVGSVFKVEGVAAVRAATESQISFILVISAIWFGSLNSAREVVKELPIYFRERSVNLKILPYLTSKILPLSFLCLIQCVLLMGIVSLLVSLSGNFLERVLTLFLSGMAATCLGLAVSSFVDSNDKAVALVPILLIPQVVLANAVVQLDKVGLLIAKSSIISFWALDAMKATLSLESRTARDMSNQLVVQISGVYSTDLAMIIVLGCSFLVLAFAGLLLKDRRS